MTWSRIIAICAVDPDLDDMTLVQGNDTPCVVDKNCVQYTDPT